MIKTFDDVIYNHKHSNWYHTHHILNITQALYEKFGEKKKKEYLPMLGVVPPSSKPEHNSIRSAPVTNTRYNNLTK